MCMSTSCLTPSNKMSQFSKLALMNISRWCHFAYAQTLVVLEARPTAERRAHRLEHKQRGLCSEWKDKSKWGKCGSGQENSYLCDAKREARQRLKSNTSCEISGQESPKNGVQFKVPNKWHMFRDLRRGNSSECVFDWDRCSSLKTLEGRLAGSVV